ncbi:MAG: hypothetical protein NTY99_02100 [DPANN group archaeon]|nr:hypothetical protein [DPANN group archaeon]
MSTPDNFKPHLSGDELKQAEEIANILGIPLKEYLTKILHNALPPHTKEELELDRMVAEYVGIPFMEYLAETILDAEKRTNYKNKELDTSYLSLELIARNGHLPYPTITKEDFKEMFRQVMAF